MIAVKQHLATITCLLLAGAGCVSSQVSAQRVATAKSAIQVAEQRGATNDPEAALHLKLAQEEFAQGNSYVNKGNGTRAHYLFDRAQADAQLALALVQAKEALTESNRAASELQNNIQEQGVSP